MGLLLKYKLNTRPVISSVDATESTTSCVVAWTTDVPSDSRVEYGLSLSYGTNSSLNETLVTSHSVNLPGLTESTLYHYRVRSSDIFGNPSCSSDYTFTTEAGTPPVVEDMGWEELTSTLMSAAAPPDEGGYDFSHNAGVTGAWGGGCYDPVGKKLYMTGGGDQDYFGNEVYSLNAGLATPTLTRLDNPSLYADINLGAAVNDDGKPNARHTYNGLEWLPTQGVMMMFGGVWSGTPGMARDIWWYDPATTTWTQKLADPQTTFGQYVTMIARDSVRDIVWMKQCGGNYGIYTYTPATNTVVRKMQYSSGANNYCTMLHDPVRDRCVLLGNNNNGTEVIRWFSTADASDFAMNTPTTYGDQTAEQAKSPGFVYDSASDRYVAWCGGSTLYYLDPDTWEWTTEDMNALYGVAGPSANSAGTFGRFRYDADSDMFVSYNSVAVNAYLLRPRISKTLKTWSVVSYDVTGADGSGGKHQRYERNIHDGKIYITGGDHVATVGKTDPAGILQSGRNEIYSYHIGQNVWAEVQPYFRPDSSLQAGHPDETGWCYDSNRALFWMIPGYTHEASGCATNYPTMNHLFDTLMSYNPTTDVWSQYGGPTYLDGGKAAFYTYDRITDACIKLTESNGDWVDRIYYPASDTWATKVLYASNYPIQKSHPAFDQRLRLIYFMPETASAEVAGIWKYDVAARTVTKICDLPAGAPAPVEEMMLLWDAGNRVLHYIPRNDNTDTTCFLYTIDPANIAGGWEAANMTFEDYTISCRNAYYDRAQNVIMIHGNRTSGGLFFYRYGNGA